MASEQLPPTTAVDRILESAQYKQLVQSFKNASGLELHAYNLEAVPLSIPFDPPLFCRTLQDGLDCPLYFDPNYHQASAPEIRVTCAGLGHVVVPVMGPDGRQVLSLVSDSARFGPVDMEQIIEKSFRLRLVPDDLAAQAEAVPLASRERVMLAAHILFAGLHEVAAGEAVRADALELLIRHVATAPTDTIPRVILDAVMEFTGAEFAYISLLDNHGIQARESSTLRSRAEWWRILSGMAEWVVDAQRPIEMADVSKSAWCRYLAGSAPPPAAIAGVPLVHDGVFGAIVLGGANLDQLDRWRDSLALFVDACSDGLLLCRRLVEKSNGAMVDRSGAYDLHFLEELLDKEISRAGRHHKELSVVLIDLVNHPELLKNLGRRGLEEVLGQMVDLIRSKTRKVNSLARVSDSAFALVIPEADQETAERIADKLRSMTQLSAYETRVKRDKPPIKLRVKTRTVTNPRAVDSALENLNSPN